MSEEEKEIQENLTPAQRVRSDWKVLVEKMSYKAIVTNIPFLLFLSLLCLIYISNSHSAIEMERDLNVKANSLKELRWKYLDTKTQLMKTKTETQVIRNAERIGLKPATIPAYSLSKEIKRN